VLIRVHYIDMSLFMSSSVTSALGSFAIFKISLISYYLISILKSGSDFHSEAATISYLSNLVIFELVPTF
jgi:hypothetical protein